MLSPRQHRPMRELSRQHPSTFRFVDSSVHFEVFTKGIALFKVFVRLAAGNRAHQRSVQLSSDCNFELPPSLLGAVPLLTLENCGNLTLGILHKIHARMADMEPREIKKQQQNQSWAW